MRRIDANEMRLSIAMPDGTFLTGTPLDYPQRFALSAYAHALPERSGAEEFARKIAQLWPHCQHLHTSYEECVHSALRLLEHPKEPRLCLHNLRILAGQKPRFKDRIKIRL